MTSEAIEEPLCLQVKFISNQNRHDVIFTVLVKEISKLGELLSMSFGAFSHIKNVDCTVGLVKQFGSKRPLLLSLQPYSEIGSASLLVRHLYISLDELTLRSLLHQFGFCRATGLHK